MSACGARRCTPASPHSNRAVKGCWSSNTVPAPAEDVCHFDYRHQLWMEFSVCMRRGRLAEMEACRSHSAEARRNEAQLGYSTWSHPDLLNDFPGFGNGLLECQGMSRIAK